ncbi:hypothetical protein AVEN_115383-1 [Araneus ventricosus]|uniref:Uncharacterized protein n=1 Tax=Araneus ventricosus TaxID=182803 RepID=A0A4Y1ZZI2_ARAVE|nr:hypothetical protein AVEN_115383-1 [Araneus ventricosus]
MHPLNCRKIWAFADPPRYLKLLRNHFLDIGLVLKDGTVLTQNIFEEVFTKDQGEYKLCLKLKQNFLTVRVNTREDSINEGYLTADILKNSFAEKDIQEIHELPSEEDDLVAFENIRSEEFPMEWKIDEPSNYCGMTFSEHEGLKYIAGYIASAYDQKIPL